MASTYSPNLRLELITTGEQQGTWGSTTNNNLGTLLEEAIGGYVSVTVSDVADTTLTTNNGSVDQSRNMVINLTGALTGTRNVICPAIEKLYVVRNATTGGQSIVFRVSGQTGVTIPNGTIEFLYVDGTDARTITGSIASQDSNNVSITGGSLSGVTVSNTSLSNVSVVANASSLGVRDSDGSHVLSIAAGSNLTANRVFTLTTGDAARTLNISAGNVTISTAGAALIDDTDASAQRTTLGLGTIATQNANNVSVTGGSITGITDLALADGGTGASLSDPAANAILGWNDTANVMRFFTAGTGIEINATSNTISSTSTTPTANTQTFNSSGTWTRPSGSYSFYAIQIWAGGGSGGKGSSGNASGGGGGGGFAEIIGSFSDLGATETVTVGSGGASVTAASTAGNQGGNSSFTRANSTTITVYGGAGGSISDGGGGGGSAISAGGTSSIIAAEISDSAATRRTQGGPDAGQGGANPNAAEDGNPGFSASTGGGGGGSASLEPDRTNGRGGHSIWGGGGGGAGAEDSNPGPGAGGVSTFGGNGGAGAFDANNATAGSQPGGGGGGSETGNSGAGGAGRIVVRVW